MTEQEQIEELVKVLCKWQRPEGGRQAGKNYNLAEFIINAGYRLPEAEKMEPKMSIQWNKHYIRMGILVARMRACHEETGKHELMDEAEMFLQEFKDDLKANQDFINSQAQAIALTAPPKRNYSMGCKLSGPGRGDCEYFIGMPEELNENTTDEYGIPNGWCDYCWMAYRHKRHWQSQVRTVKECCSACMDKGCHICEAQASGNNDEKLLNRLKTKMEEYGMPVFGDKFHALDILQLIKDSGYIPNSTAMDYCERCHKCTGKGYIGFFPSAVDCDGCNGKGIILKET